MLNDNFYYLGSRYSCNKDISECGYPGYNIMICDKNQETEKLSEVILKGVTANDHETDISYATVGEEQKSNLCAIPCNRKLP